MPRRFIRGVTFLLLVICVVANGFSSQARAEHKSAESANSPERQAKLEAALSKMLSGATLEGSFTSTGAGGDPSKLSRDK
jgi:hypothetical protein